MKSIIYKNPVISAIIINIVTLVILIYSINSGGIWGAIIPVFTGIGNRRIIDNGQNVDKQKKKIILFSFILMLLVFLTYSKYMYNLRNIEIINGL
ncbi:hypothetical protein [Clostridium sp.]|uniref:hypothetical protein n=1 Tax=Clostridium sp. TaxID=1506 RepID=UPI00290DADB6|nr:hypothetical protein [Clostridium sp.]MDU5108645.1 hypothetical protein [Clostridium sp.]